MRMFNDLLTKQINQGIYSYLKIWQTELFQLFQAAKCMDKVRINYFIEGDDEFSLKIIVF